MKQVHLTINVPESKYNQLIEFLTKNFGEISISESDEIPDWQKKIVRERIKNTEPEKYISWGEAQKQLKFK